MRRFEESLFSKASLVRKVREFIEEILFLIGESDSFGWHFTDGFCEKQTSPAC